MTKITKDNFLEEFYKKFPANNIKYAGYEVDIADWWVALINELLKSQTNKELDNTVLLAERTAGYERGMLDAREHFKNIIGDDYTFPEYAEHNPDGRKCICVDCNFARGYNLAKEQIRNLIKSR